MNIQKLPGKSTGPNRFGVTLTEVLMSLMIMAIGVTSVMTLFPIATLKSAQATKRTNAAILKYNVENQLDIQPALIFDPDGDGNLTEHFRGGQRNYIVDPNGYFSMLEYGNDLGIVNNTSIADSFGHTASNAPSGLPRFDGGVASSLGITVDPTTLTDPQRRALRIAAQDVTSLGDGWETQFEFTLPNPFAGSAGTSLFGPNGAVTGLLIPREVIPDAASLALLPTSATETPIGLGRDSERTRVVIFTVDEEYSQSFPLLYVDTNNLVPGENVAVWSEAVAGVDFNNDGYRQPRTLPREFRVDTNSDGVPDTTAVGKVMIQTRRSIDFSWFLTVRRSPDGTASGVDVVVRFGGEPKYEDEYLYGTTLPATFPASALTITSAGPEPALKKGGFVFDVASARWHRIRDHREVSTGVYRITLERPATTLGASVMIIPGIVDVYPMGSKSL